MGSVRRGITIDSYIEEFWYGPFEYLRSGARPDIRPTLSPPRRYESYLSHSDPVVLALNPFFVLE